MTPMTSPSSGDALERLIEVYSRYWGSDLDASDDELISAARAEKAALVEALKRIAHGWTTMDEEEMSGIAQEALALLSSTRKKG